MRRSGKTTRMIDEAIQGLFEVGGIVIPTANMVNKRMLESAPKYPVYVDPDYNEEGGVGGIQREFLERLERRIKLEHPNVESRRVSSLVIFEVF